MLDRLARRSIKFVRDRIIEGILEKRTDVWAERFTLTDIVVEDDDRRTAAVLEQMHLASDHIV